MGEPESLGTAELASLESGVQCVAPGPAAMVSAARMPGGAVTDGLRILMVDEAAAAAELMARQLAAAGIACRHLQVASEKDFRAALREFRPHLILSQRRLTGFDGHTALEIARRELPQIPFIFISGVPAHEREERLRDQLETRVARLTRMLQMQSGINEAVVRIRDRAELLREACRIALELGGYEHVMISLVTADGSRARPWHRLGMGPAALDSITFPIGDGTEPDASLVGAALRTGRITFIADLRESQPPMAGRAELLEKGFRSIVVLPLSVEGARIGALSLASRESDQLSTEELQLLQDIVANLSFALQYRQKETTAYLHFQLQMHSDIAQRLALELKLRIALDEQQFQLYYQPQINIATGRIEAVEALLRWRDPDEGLMPPAVFLSVLESSGMIVPVGEWVLQEAVKDCRRWRAMNLDPVRIAVNVSVQQIHRRSFVDQVLAAATGCGGNGFGLDIEITETGLLRDMEGASRKLRDLRNAGIRIAIDDFGTGYSSLGLLSKLPVDILKIDRSFISELPADRASVTLVSSIIGLAAAFDLAVVAEGVETLGQLEVLRRLKCNYSQGYLHSRPVPPAEIERMLAAQTTRTPRVQQLEQQKRLTLSPM